MSRRPAPERSYAQLCGIATALDVVGDRWSLLVLRDSLSGWTDLGNSTRLIDTLVRHGIEPEWLKRERMHGAGALAALRSTAS